MTLTDVFGLQGHLDWWQECLRALVIFAYGLSIVRLFGRRAFGKWSALDIIVSIMVGSNLSRALTGSAPLVGTLAATTLLMVLHWVLAQFAARSKWFSAVVEGSPIKLAHEGAADPSAMLRGSISEHDLQEALREHGVDNLGATRLVMLEPSGKITVLKSGA
jgi:uncharacterized membrane protein YcaP (DUF421 family)